MTARPNSARALAGALTALAALAAPLASGCLQEADPAASEQLELDCRGVPCPWTFVPKRETSGDTTWLTGDLGVDLSGTGHAEAEQKVVMLQQTSRTLDLRAGIVRDAAATLRVEIAWYGAGPGIGKTFWDRQPTLLEPPKSYDIWEEGSNRVRRTILVPSEGAAFVLRIVKDSSSPATVMVGDLTIGHPSGSEL